MERASLHFPHRSSIESFTLISTSVFVRHNHLTSFYMQKPRKAQVLYAVFSYAFSDPGMSSKLKTYIRDDGVVMVEISTNLYVVESIAERLGLLRELNA
jgi:hypothetical protein